ncbi:MAG: hypothetical protein IKN04_05625 [Clostridia bacterium]|nr:hypothetical protein [Clostridia bacterium]
MNKPEENELIEENADHKTIVQSAKDFMNGVLSPLKGKDIGQLVEDFTAEMTLVAEGLSEDQHKLSQETERLSTMQTELEQRMLDGFHDAGVTHDETRSEIKDLRSRLERIEKQLDKKELKTKKSDGITGMLRQATWLVAIASGAWIVVTIINALT